jgi:protein-S-isoprenylcysteine O-methyltransferase Ste14
VIHVLMRSSIRLGRLPPFGWLRVCLRIHFFCVCSQSCSVMGLFDWPACLSCTFGFSRALSKIMIVALAQVNIVPAHLHPALSYRDYSSLGLYTSFLLFEIIADRQKSAWRRAQENKEHEEKFITSGLWSLSRHPKYPFYFQIE